MNSPWPEITFGPITHQQIRDYAEASGDFNEIHLNPEFAKTAGFSDVIAHGMLSMGLMGVALEKWGVTTETLKSFETKFKDVVHVGDYLTARVTEQNQKTWQVELETQDGRQVCTATAEVN